MPTPSSSARAPRPPEAPLTRAFARLRAGARARTPPGRRFRQHEMHDIVGIACREARAVLAGNDVVRGRDDGAQLSRRVPLSAERRDQRRQLGVHDCPEPPVSLREAQQTVDRWIGQYKEGYFPPLTNLARLTEEVGELAREVNHRFGEKTRKPAEPQGSLAMELADILFVG